MKNSITSDIRRYLLKLQGVVQGVGYRPYVFNAAITFNIKGWVRNQGSALEVDLEGEENNVKAFLIKIIKEPPKLAAVEKVEIVSEKCVGYKDFQIYESSISENEIKFIATDVATCTHCISEVLDATNPRYQYAFTNCTSCGPRYSIIKALPYDRINTTMRSFKMCPSCEKEYLDNANRRFHAEPTCCPHCGPSLELLNSKGEPFISDNPIKDAIEFIKQGKIVALKGLGGFHLACKAEDEKAIEILRSRKNRPHKPFAILVKNIETAKRLAYVSKEEEEVLVSSKRPIVVLNKKECSILPSILAPHTKKIGIMLPYTPLHFLLFQEGLSYLVMTSGNISGGPIQYDNAKGITSLRNIADYFLIHDREINVPVEDSVVKVIDGNEIVIRRARGYTPCTIKMKVNNEILALGAEQKSAFCLSKKGYGYMSQYLGDLKDFDTYTDFHRAINNLTALLHSKPTVLAHDSHSRFLYLEQQKHDFVRKIPVQHHHAHMVSCMIEHNITKPVIGVVFDGTGLGTDGTIWGGEFLLGTKEGFTRVGHLKTVNLQGGDAAIKEPWRVAVSYLHSIGYDAKKVLKPETNNFNNYPEGLNTRKQESSGIDKEEIYVVTQALEKNINCFTTSSMGRFFDAVASLLNVRHVITYDAQGVIELENILDPSVRESYNYHILEKDALQIIDYTPILISILKDMEEGTPVSVISAKFHNTIASATVDLVCSISQCFGIKEVVLSGGVFENNYLLLYVSEKLKEKAFDVYYNQQIPTNDSGISIGQLAIADAIEGKR